MDKVWKQFTLAFINSHIITTHHHIKQSQNNCLLTFASTVKWYMDCVSKSNGPSNKIVPSVVSGEAIFCLIANNGDPHNSKYTGFVYNGFFLAIT